MADWRRLRFVHMLESPFGSLELVPVFCRPRTRAIRFAHLPVNSSVVSPGIWRPFVAGPISAPHAYVANRLMISTAQPPKPSALRAAAAIP